MELDKRKGTSKYRQLEVDRISRTGDRLIQRIRERFPKSNIGGVAVELGMISKSLEERADWITRPLIMMRCATALGITLLTAIVVYFTQKPILAIVSEPEKFEAGEYLQAAEAVMSGLFFIGLLLVFLLTLEQRVKRHRALEAIHELRAIAHVIDMHQLTKDPSYFLEESEDTESSPLREMTWFELVRYLSYCSELLAIVGKLAAYYAQNHEDAVIYDAVNDVENLTNDLARKIWQKIAVSHAYSASNVGKKEFLIASS